MDESGRPTLIGSRKKGDGSCHHVEPLSRLLRRPSSASPALRQHQLTPSRSAAAGPEVPASGFITLAFATLAFIMAGSTGRGSIVERRYAVEWWRVRRQVPLPLELIIMA